MATNMTTQPIASLALIRSESMIAPAKTANTDSIHMIRDAADDSVYFCPMICKVYATPLLITPEYKSGTIATRTASILVVSSINDKIADIMVQVKN